MWKKDTIQYIESLIQERNYNNISSIHMTSDIKKLILHC